MANPVSTVIRFCLHCDKETAVHAETLRCQTCGLPTARGEMLDRLKQQSPNGAAGPTVLRPSTPSPPSPAPEKLVLEETPLLRRWAALTQEVGDKLQERAERSKKFAQQYSAEAKQLQQAASAFSGLIGQISIQTPAAREAGKSPRKPPGAWARDSERCIQCGTTDVPHAARGYCKRCYDRIRPGASA